MVSEKVGMPTTDVSGKVSVWIVVYVKQ